MRTLVTDDLSPIERWRAEVDAAFARMQTPEFAAAVRRILDEPMRVPVPEHLRTRDPSDDRPTCEWWWLVSEAERDEWAGRSAAEARAGHAEKLYAAWRREAANECERWFTEDLIARVQRHLRDGTGVRRKEP